MFGRLVRTLFPGVCLGCDLDLPPGQDIDLCGACRAALPWIVAPCPRCALPLPAGPDAECAACRAAALPWNVAVAPLRYDGPVARWVRRLKDRMGMVEGRTLGLLLADAAVAAYRDRPAPDLLVPVPLMPLRLARRGHNQAIALALPVAARLRIPLARQGARRVRQAPPQRGLPLERRLANLAGAFAANQRLDGRTVGIVDDVLTSGATAGELARTLLAAGAGAVHVLCAARAVRGDTAP